MSEVFSIVANVKARVDEAKRDFATFKQSVDNSKQSLDSLGMAGDVAAGILIQQFSQNVVRAFETFGRVTVDRFADFETATARIIATTGATGDELIMLTGIIEEAAMTLGTDFGVGAASAMGGLESLVKAGLDPATEATMALEGVLQLATIEQMNTADAANMVIAAMAQYGLTAQDTTRIVDGFVQASAAGIDTAAGYASGLANVGATAASMGFSMEETLATLVQIDASQKDARRSGTFLNRMLIDLAAKSKDAQLEIYNVDGSMRSMDEIVGELRVKIQGFGNDQAALNLWLGQFQSLAQKAILSLVNYDGTIADTQIQLTGMSGAQETANVILDTYSGRLAIADAKQESAAIGMGELTSQLSLMSAEFMASLGPVGLLADSLGPPMLSGAIQGMTILYVPDMIKTLGQMVNQMGVAATASTVLGGAINFMSGPIGWIVLAVGALALAWSNDWGGIQEKTGVVIDFIMEKITWVTDGISWFGDSVREILGWVGDSWAALTATIDEHLSAQVSTVESSLDDELNAIEDGYVEQVALIKESYEERQSNLDAALAESLDVSDAHFNDLRSLTEEAYRTAVDDASQFWLDQLEETVEGWENVVDEYEDHYDQLVTDAESNYVGLIDTAEDYYGEFLSNIKQSHSDRISETESFYDDMLTEQSAFLVAIREGRNRDLDDLELNFLLQKQALEEAHEKGKTSTIQYENKLSKLEEEYRDARSEIRDDYRIQELQAEETFREEEERINSERTSKLEEIEEQSAEALTVIENALKAEVERIEQEKADEVLRINEERAADIAEIRAAEAELEKKHADELEQLALDHAASQELIILDTHQEQQRLMLANQGTLKGLETQFYADLETSEEEHKTESTDTWTSMWDDNIQTTRDSVADVETELDGMETSLSTSLTGLENWALDVVDAARNAYDDAKSWWDRVTSRGGDDGDTGDTVPDKSSKKTFVPPDRQDTGVVDVPVAGGGYTFAGADKIYASKDKANRAFKKMFPVNKAQDGFEGWVTEPTRFLAGEAGPEYVSVTPSGASPKMAGRTTIIHGPLLTIEGSADEKTAKLAAKLIMSELRKY